VKNAPGQDFLSVANPKTSEFTATYKVVFKVDWVNHFNSIHSVVNFYSAGIVNQGLAPGQLYIMF
jgi:hypothetical protein